jgi:hypothetical protein
MARSIWFDDDPLARVTYPHYVETVNRVMDVLAAAETEQGVSPQEIAAILTSLHAMAVARLRPDADNLAVVTAAFQQAVIEYQKEAED